MWRRSKRQGRALSGRDFFFGFFDSSQNIPDLFGSVAEFAAGHTCTQGVVADTDGFILERIGEVVMALGHSADKDSDALVRLQRFQIVLGADHGRLETHSDLAAVGGQVIGDWVLDHLKELLLRVGGADGESVEQLDHQTGESLERSRNADGGVDFNQHTLGRVDENLQATGLVHGGVEKSKQTLRWISRCFLLFLMPLAMLNRTWWVISGRASLISRFILRIMPMCSSLFSKENFSSLVPPRPLETAL